MEEALHALPDNQREAILDAIQAERDALRRNYQRDMAEAVAQAKHDFRAGVAGSKKPKIFDRSQISIQAFIERFEPFRGVMGLDGKPAVNAFMTYLDQNSQTTLIDHGIHEIDSWEEFKDRVIATLSSPQDRVKARFEIKRATQRAEETVEDFGRRLITLGKSAYTAEEETAKNSALRDALAGGVKRDVVAVHLINSNLKDFHELLLEAIQLDASYIAREAMQNDDSVSVSVMKSEFQAVQDPGTQTQQVMAVGSRGYGAQGEHFPAPTHLTCYRCKRPGHIASQCRFDNIPSQLERYPAPRLSSQPPGTGGLGFVPYHDQWSPENQESQRQSQAQESKPGPSNMNSGDSPTSSMDRTPTDTNR